MYVPAPLSSREYQLETAVAIHDKWNYSLVVVGSPSNRVFNVEEILNLYNGNFYNIFGKVPKWLISSESNARIRSRLSIFEQRPISREELIALIVSQRDIPWDQSVYETALGWLDQHSREYGQVGMKISAWMITLDKFIGQPLVIDPHYASWNEEIFLERMADANMRVEVLREIARTPPQLYYWSSLDQTIPTVNIYYLGVNPEDLNHILLLSESQTINGDTLLEIDPVGEWYGGNLGIMAAHRGKGIGPIFIAEAIEEKGDPYGYGNYSPKGYRNRIKAHRLIVEKAVNQGFPVPPEVLADYPDLTQ